MDMVQITNAIAQIVAECAELEKYIAEKDELAGEIATPNRFSRGYLLGYLLGYLHAAQRCYDLMPDWAMNSAALGGDNHVA